MKRYRKWRLGRIEKKLGELSRLYDYVRRLNAQGITPHRDNGLGGSGPVPYSKVQIADEIRELEAKRYELQEKLNV